MKIHSVPISRRQVLALLAGLVAARFAPAETSPLDTVRVYVVPLDDFPEDLAGGLAGALQEDLGLRVKASIRLPPLPIPLLPGTRQLIAEEILSRAVAASSRLPEATPETYRVFLTARDINGRSGNLRFLFSSHNRALNCSVVSLARLLDYPDGRPVINPRALIRLAKMSKRALGEMVFGWQRSADPEDLMYSPLMSLADLDRLGLAHREATSDPKPGNSVRTDSVI